MRKLLCSSVDIEPSPYLNEGDWVEISCGPFTGVRGRLIERHGRHKLLVGIDLIRQAISVEVDMSWVRRLDDSIKPIAAEL
ncbi:MAG: transcription termination/antitermination protein NusG [bacterium]